MCLKGGEINFCVFLQLESIRKNLSIQLVRPIRINYRIRVLAVPLKINEQVSDGYPPIFFEGGYSKNTNTVIVRRKSLYVRIAMHNRTFPSDVWQ